MQIDILKFLSINDSTLRRTSNWPPSFYNILGKFAEKFKLPNISLIQFIPNLYNKTSLKFDHGNKLNREGKHGHP